MTSLTLDHTQRLNIIAMLDRVEWPGRREAWEVHRLQHKLDLTDEERAIIGWRKMKTDDGREYAMWSNGPALTPNTYDLQDDDIQRICKAMDNHPVMLVRDRAWWEPLNAQLPPPPPNALNAQLPPEAFTPNGLVQQRAAAPAN